MIIFIAYLYQKRENDHILLSFLDEIYVSSTHKNLDMSKQIIVFSIVTIIVTGLSVNYEHKRDSIHHLNAYDLLKK